MRRSFIILFLLVTVWMNAGAQEIGLNVNYQFIAAKEWDKATQTYNFSRPFLENKQPLLRHGISFGLYYLPKPDNAFSLGPSVSFSLHRSSSENPNFDISINSLLLDLGLKMRYRPTIGQSNRLHLSLTPSLTGVRLGRKLNGEIVIIGPTEEDQNLRTFGFGVGLNTQIGYDFSTNKDWVISPTIGLNYKPYLWAKRSDVIFNEAATGDLTADTNTWGFQGGIILRRK